MLRLSVLTKGKAKAKALRLWLLYLHQLLESVLIYSAGSVPLLEHFVALLHRRIETLTGKSAVLAIPAV